MKVLIVVFQFHPLHLFSQTNWITEVFNGYTLSEVAIQSFAKHSFNLIQFYCQRN